MTWEIIFYQTSSGKRVVEDFIDNLDTTARSKTVRQIELLATYGATLGMPHAKLLGGGLFELRVRGKREVRIFYVHIATRRIILLHGFVKKTQATPKKELNLTRKRQQEVSS